MTANDTRQEQCHSCGGSGMGPTYGPPTCPSCGGTGTVCWKRVPCKKAEEANRFA